MVDPLSLAAVTAAVQAVASGAANEAGKRAWDSLGVLTQRLLGRPVPAPSGRAEYDALARTLREAAARRRDGPAELALLDAFAPPSVTGRPGPVAAGHQPRTTRHFTDREDVFRALGAEERRTGFGPRAVLLHGPAGAGTSAVAVHWAHRAAARFPDGTLYADLHGGSAGTAVPPSAVLRRFLERLGAPAENLPSTTEDLTALFRELASARRLIVVLDHVHSAASAAPFLVDAPGVFTLVVARRPLPGLEAREVGLGPLPDRHALRLLKSITVDSPAAADRSGLRATVRRCAGSPYALTMLAREVRATPGLTWSAVGEQLDAGVRVPAPAGGAAHDAGPAVPSARGPADGAGVPGDPVQAVVAVCASELTDAARELWHLLALRPWPGVRAQEAARMAGTESGRAAALLSALAEKGLLETSDGERYTFRPAVRAVAEREARRVLGPSGCDAAVAASTAAWLRLAVERDHRALPDRWRLGPLYRELRGREVTGDESREALDLLEKDRGNLVEAVRAAHSRQDAETVVQLCEALWALLLKTGHHGELLPALRTGARTADARFPGSRTAGRMHTQLAYALMFLGEYEEAERAQEAAVRAEEAAGHRRGLATALEQSGVQLLHRWRYAEADERLARAGAVLDALGADEEGAADVPRARAILTYHRGRVARGEGRHEDAVRLFTTAQRRFGALAVPDHYNRAKSLTGAAETRLDAGERTVAAALLDEARTALGQAGGSRLLEEWLTRLGAACAAPEGS